MRAPIRTFLALCGSALTVACDPAGDRAGDEAVGPTDPGPGEREDDRAVERAALVDLLAKSGIRDPRVLDAMRAVRRHRFVPEDVRRAAYHDRALPIGWRQTISQPYVVAFMTESLGLDGDERVLEIGTGSGYQAAVLSQLVREVYTIEIVEPLAERAAATLIAEGCDNVRTRVGDGYRGWPEEAPFDAVMVTAAPDHVPEPLIEQLAVGGRLVIPVGAYDQELLLVEKTERGLVRRSILPVAFVPMTGEAQER